MLTHETCLQLRAAGFPQREPRFLHMHILRDGNICNSSDCESRDEWIPTNPTLEELITEVEKMKTGFQLHQFGEEGENKWMARNWYDNPVYADTPEEAVANLYLALKTK